MRRRAWAGAGTWERQTQTDMRVVAARNSTLPKPVLSVLPKNDFITRNIINFLGCVWKVGCVSDEPLTTEASLNSRLFIRNCQEREVDLAPAFSTLAQRRRQGWGSPQRGRYCTSVTLSFTNVIFMSLYQ